MMNARATGIDDDLRFERRSDTLTLNGGRAGPEPASAEVKRIAGERITKEMADVVTYCEQPQTGERAVFTLQQQ